MKSHEGFTLLEVLLAAVILGFGLAGITTAMSQNRKMMLASTELQTAQEVMDLGDMAYPLADVTDPDKDLDVSETKAEELWEMISGERLSSAQQAKYKGYTWEREALNRKADDDELKRIGYLYTVRITVKWDDDRRGNHKEESYVTFWRKPQE